MSDEQIARFIAGDADATTDVVRAVWPTLVRVVRRKPLSFFDAEEIANDVLVVLWKLAVSGRLTSSGFVPSLESFSKRRRAGHIRDHMNKLDGTVLVPLPERDV